MDLVYSDHALKRMKERAVSESDVETCLRDHDILSTDRNGNPKYSRHIGERYIKVVVAKDDHNFVITVED
ncbi:MAG: DUF4258 domain-containing protein [Chloroflexi bacterium]|nr:DUF4258 domain-containing protein [Chloroflexota bacterium]